MVLVLALDHGGDWADNVFLVANWWVSRVAVANLSWWRPPGVNSRLLFAYEHLVKCTTLCVAWLRREWVEAVGIARALFTHRAWCRTVSAVDARLTVRVRRIRLRACIAHRTLRHLSITNVSVRAIKASIGTTIINALDYDCLDVNFCEALFNITRIVNICLRLCCERNKVDARW